MSDTLKHTIEDDLRELMENYEKALRSGIKLQEDTINRWKDVLGNRNSDRVLSLSEKTVSVYKAPTASEAQGRLKNLTEGYFGIARENLTPLTDTLYTPSRTPARNRRLLARQSFFSYKNRSQA